MRNRKGAAAVEFAVVAPIFLLFIFGMIEFGRIIMVQQIMTNAARETARACILDRATLADAQKKVNDWSFTVMPTMVCTPAPGSAKYGELQTVTLSVPLSKATWLPPMFLPQNATLTAASSMRRESVR